MIRDDIMDIYKAEYTGKLCVRKLPIGYHISFGMNVPEKPLVLCAFLEDEDFLKWLRQALIDCRFNLRYFGELRLTYPCIPQSGPCCD